MSGRLHIVDDDNLTGAKVYEECVVTLYPEGAGEAAVEVTVLRKHGAVFANVLNAHLYVDIHNSLFGEERP